MGSWEQVAGEHPMVTKSTQQDFWRTYLADNPTVMYRLLADLHGVARRFRGEDPGRVPTVEELRGLVTPSYSNDPFPVALRAALGKRSARWLAGRLNMHFSYVCRLLNGERDVVDVNDPRHSMDRLEAIARELRVHPSYFAEWRRLWVMTLMDAMFEDRPNLSIGVWERFGEPVS